jgi:hypothetical protein
VCADTEIPKDNADASPKNIVKKGLRVTLAIAAFINAPVKSDVFDLNEISHSA